MKIRAVLGHPLMPEPYKTMLADPGYPLGWRTDAGNRAGTAHLYSSAEGELARAVCGREVRRSDLQSEAESLRRCKRCAVVASPST